MIFESHAHYDDEAFDPDRDELLSGMRQHGIETVINVSADLDSVNSSLDLAHKYPDVFAAVGIHPSETMDLNDETFEWLKEKTDDERCVAIGEIGLDYHFLDEYPDPDKETQQYWFERQLELANEKNKPVIIHSRDASADTLNILKKPQYKNITAVMHCYSYSAQTAKELTSMGYYFGIGGVITFKNAKKLVEALKIMPVDRILLETDCPYLAPTPHRGERNNSYYIPLIAQKIAELKDMDYEEVVKQTCENAKRFFGLG